jgi:hypothetical protein
MVLALRLYVLNGYQNKQRHLPYTTLTDLFCITDAESVYYAVRTESLRKTVTSRLLKCYYIPIRCLGTKNNFRATTRIS